ncbi:MAG: hypothetical protein KAS16_02790 [Thermoplasmata archaeon]|nr:hypothetical protein [Thermoplasmata archaeon]
MRKLMPIMIAMMFIAMLFSVSIPNAEASYRLSIKGATDFIGEPWTGENYTGYVIVGLGEESQSELDISLVVTGDIAQWLVWNGTESFTLYPAEEIIIRFTIFFPESAPDEYTGLITATGVPPSRDEISGGAVVPGNIAVAIGASVNVLGRVYFQDTMANQIGANTVVFNGLESNFTGNVTYNLTQDGTWIETHKENITSLPSNQSIEVPINWNITPQLGVVYDISFLLTGFNDTILDEKITQFKMPTPAEIQDTGHVPNVIYANSDVTIYATVSDAQNGDTECEAHYTIDSGTEITGSMSYDPNNDIYLLLVDNSSYYEGAIVDYWVTSHNDASGTVYTDTSSTKTFYVFPANTPDLVIDENSVVFTPWDPYTQPMNETDTTNIFITVKNTGREGVLNVKVRVFDRDVPIWNDTIPAIASDGNSDTVHFNWAPTEGTHLLRFVVDPDDDIIETDENNNYYTLDEITIHAAPYVEPTTGGDDPTNNDLSFVAIPLIILLAVFLLLFLLKKKKKINVMVYKAKPTRTDKDGNMRWTYNCTYGDDISIGNTDRTPIKATKGDIIQVEVDGLVERDDGRIVWQSGVAVKLQDKMDKADDVEKIKKMATKKDKK